MASALRISPSVLTPSESTTLAALSSLGRLWVTGGWVRDKVLAGTGVNPRGNAAWQELRDLAGCPVGDLDVIVDGATAHDFFKVCRLSSNLRSQLRAPPVFVPSKGSGRSLDTVKLRLGEHSVDITSFIDARTQLGLDLSCGSVTPSGMLVTDAEHRDTTFNALYYEPGTGQVVDPSGKGLLDLKAGIVRNPHSEGAMASFREDPIRLLRAFRFAARFEFDLEDSLGEGLTDPGEFVDLLRNVPYGRVLYEVKKALLVHNRPNAFLSMLAGPCEVHRLLFGVAGDTFLNTWPAAVGRVRRLEALMLQGFQRRVMTSRSAYWRGRKDDGPPAALLASDWRKMGVGENDWAELLLAALLWRCDSVALQLVGKKFELSKMMIENIAHLQNEARQGLHSSQTASPGVHLLRAAVAGEAVFSPSKFWDAWPCGPVMAEDQIRWQHR